MNEVKDSNEILTSHRMNYLKLNNGVEMPQVGLGTYLIPDQELERTIATAIDLGYRKFDTALRYNNEREIAKALKKRPIASFSENEVSLGLFKLTTNPNCLGSILSSFPIASDNIFSLTTPLVNTVTCIPRWIMYRI